MTPDDLRRGPVAEAIRAARLIVVLRQIQPLDRLVALVEELVEAGAAAFEITFDAPSAATDLVAVREHVAGRGGGPFLVGAGTLTSREHLAAARRAGADFGVSPLLDPALVREAVGAGLPFVPGALTPTEIAAGWAAGATWVKLFPASAVGPSFIREMRGPMPDVALIPTGGIDATNARDWFEAGAAAVGIGGAIVRADAAGRRSIVEATRPGDNGGDDGHGNVLSRL